MLITNSCAARILQLSEAAVRKMADRGELPVQRTANGIRLYDQAEIERLASARAGQARSGEAA